MLQDIPVCNLILLIINWQVWKTSDCKKKNHKKFTLDGMQDLFKNETRPQSLSILSEHKETQQICTFYSHLFFAFSVLIMKIRTP